MEKPNAMDDPTKWSCNEVSNWLTNNGFQKYCQLICVEHQIDGQGLLSLTENDLKQSPIEIRVLGDVKRLTHLIKSLKTKCVGRSNGTVLYNGVIPMPRQTSLQMVDRINAPTDSSDIECNEFDRNITHHPRNLDPEKGKAALAVCYMIFGLLCTCYCIVVVQSKAPDQQKHPPLPDIFLNTFPQISWAPKLSEGAVLSLMVIWIIIAVLNKHRWILMRRTFCLLGTMYLLRCVCILITQLPVPETNVICDRKNYTDFLSRAGRTLEIFFGAGLKVSGLKTCGDYMFSGHTVSMTMFNFFITEYTPKKMCYIHILSWILNLGGMFFILAGHGHYSIDVFVAFVFTSRLFCYYHTLANNINLMSRDTKRTKIWFPVFSYFEANSTGVVPLEFEWPFYSWSNIKNYLRGYEIVSSKDKS
ncbi:Hypothetical predicted protein [Mytilus galloprovincialis]|uniref:SAM domain-containing protein n=2 Tax=Mytilus galloprovincialis TaxID=29158 RepID=A0A8B6F8I3_MYTGA|nr:Hypothetical predicted protein [Mytilus galloprovincialis]